MKSRDRRLVVLKIMIALCTFSPVLLFEGCNKNEEPNVSATNAPTAGIPPDTHKPDETNVSDSKK